VRASLAAVLVACLSGLTACVDRLPEQDRRITAATPAAKLSVDLLFKEYRADRKAADRNFWGKALDVSGRVTAVEKSPAKLVFTLETPHGVDAFLLDDQSAEILSSTEVNQRVTLRCYCAGLTGENVTLRSCIRP
jgi:hypothetical protein